MITRIDLYQYDQCLINDWPEDAIATIDLDASAKQYMTMLAKSVKANYPQAIVTWQLTDSTPTTSAHIEGDDTPAEIFDARASVDGDGTDIYASTTWQIPCSTHALSVGA